MGLKKRGQVEVQFNWIYVGIVGAVLLMVFVGIAFTIKQGAQKDYEREAIRYFNDIFTSMQGSENTENTMSLPGLEIGFKHRIDSCAQYSIGTQQEPIESLPVFAPDLIKGNLVSYSLGWDYPFRADYFLYLTSGQVVYVLVGDAKKFGDLLPKNLNKEEVDSISDFKNNNYYKVKFITVNDADGQGLDSKTSILNDKDVTALQIDEAAKAAFFYAKKGSSLEKKQGSGAFFLDSPTMIALIFSESPGAYECNMDKAIRRLSKLAFAAKVRAEKLKSSRDTACVDLYGQATGMLDSIYSQTKDAHTIDALQSIASQRDSLNVLNSKLNAKACPTLY